jgi:hypothetical protein
MISETERRLDVYDGRISFHRRLAACISNLSEEYAQSVPWIVKDITSARAAYSVPVPAALPYRRALISRKGSQSAHCIP